MGQSERSQNLIIALLISSPPALSLGAIGHNADDRRTAASECGLENNLTITCEALSLLTALIFEHSQI
jgi:hypothetical protein